MKKTIHSYASLHHAAVQRDARQPQAERVQTVYIIDMEDDAEAAAWDAEMRRRGF